MQENNRKCFPIVSFPMLSINIINVFLLIQKLYKSWIHCKDFLLLKCKVNLLNFFARRFSEEEVDYTSFDVEGNIEIRF